MTVHKLEIDVTCEILAWMTTDLVKKIRSKDWLAAAVNLSWQQNKLESLVEVMAHLAAQEDPVEDGRTMGAVLDDLLASDRSMQEAFEKDLGEAIEAVVEAHKERE